MEMTFKPYVIRMHELTLEEYIYDSIKKGKLPSEIRKSLENIGIKYGLDKAFAKDLAKTFIENFPEWTAIKNAEHIVCCHLSGGKTTVIAKMKYLSSSTVHNIIRAYRDDPYEIVTQYDKLHKEQYPPVLFAIYMMHFYREHEEYMYVKS